MKFIYKILVPTDFSELSLSAMEYAISFAKIYDAKIYMIHVIEQPSAFMFHSVDIESETSMRDAEVEAMNELKIFMATKLPNVRGIIPVVRRGDICKELINYAKEQKFDLIVMATHGHTGVAHILLGSIAEKIVRNSSVPVMTVKPEEMQEGFIAQDEVKEQLHIN